MMQWSTCNLSPSQAEWHTLLLMWPTLMNENGQWIMITRLKYWESDDDNLLCVALHLYSLLCTQAARPMHTILYNVSFFADSADWHCLGGLHIIKYVISHIYFLHTAVISHNYLCSARGHYFHTILHTAIILVDLQLSHWPYGACSNLPSKACLYLLLQEFFLSHHTL